VRGVFGNLDLEEGRLFPVVQLILIIGILIIGSVYRGRRRKVHVNQVPGEVSGLQLELSPIENQIPLELIVILACVIKIQIQHTPGCGKIIVELHHRVGFEKPVWYRLLSSTLDVQVEVSQSQFKFPGINS